MPPHMHPRSRMTASLFTTTLMVSFLVVAAPHLIPCPVDPRTLNDSADPTRPRRRRRAPGPGPDDASPNALLTDEARRAMVEERFSPKRECPIPKPGGLVGQVLGMTSTGEEDMTVTSHLARSRASPSSNNDQ